MLLVSQTKSGTQYARKVGGKKRSCHVVSRPQASKDSVQGKLKQSSDFLPNVMSLTLLSTCLPQLPKEKFRHSYQLMDGTEFLDKDCFRIDLIELPKLRERISEVPERQRIWLEFFLARSYAEVKQLGEQESVIRSACEVLEMMSEDEKLKDLARRIWQGEFARKHIELLKKEEEEQKRREFEEQTQAEAEAKAEVKVAQTNALAIRTLAAMGLSSDAIAEKLKLSHENVLEILNSQI